MVTKNIEGFSVTHAAILDGSTGADQADIYGVRGGSIDVDMGTYDNTGDDAVLSSWHWFNFANLSIQGGYIPFDTLALLTGATITSSGSGDTEKFELPLWNEASLNQPTYPVKIRVPSKTSDGKARTLDFILYKVQFQPIDFDGPAYKDGLVLNYAGRCLLSDNDEEGNALAERAIGRLVSHKLP